MVTATLVLAAASTLSSMLSSTSLATSKSSVTSEMRSNNRTLVFPTTTSLPSKVPHLDGEHNTIESATSNPVPTSNMTNGIPGCDLACLQHRKQVALDKVNEAKVTVEAAKMAKQEWLNRDFPNGKNFWPQWWLPGNPNLVRFIGFNKAISTATKEYKEALSVYHHIILQITGQPDLALKTEAEIESERMRLEAARQAERERKLRVLKWFEEAKDQIPKIEEELNKQEAELAKLRENARPPFDWHRIAQVEENIRNLKATWRELKEKLLPVDDSEQDIEEQDVEDRPSHSEDAANVTRSHEPRHDIWPPQGYHWTQIPPNPSASTIVPASNNYGPKAASEEIENEKRDHGPVVVTNMSAAIAGKSSTSTSGHNEAYISVYHYPWRSNTGTLDHSASTSISSSISQHVAPRTSSAGSSINGVNPAMRSVAYFTMPAIHCEETGCPSPHYSLPLLPARPTTLFTVKHRNSTIAGSVARAPATALTKSTAAKSEPTGFDAIVEAATLSIMRACEEQCTLGEMVHIGTPFADKARFSFCFLRCVNGGGAADLFSSNAAAPTPAGTATPTHTSHNPSSSETQAMVDTCEEQCPRDLPFKSGHLFEGFNPCFVNCMRSGSGGGGADSNPAPSSFSTTTASTITLSSRAPVTTIWGTQAARAPNL